MKLPQTTGWLHGRWVVFTSDVLMIPVAWLGAFWLRFNLDVIPATFFHQALLLLPIIVVLQGAVCLYFDVYRGLWRFASLPDLVGILRAVGVGTGLCALVVFLVTRLTFVPRAVFPLFALLLVGLLSLPRFAYRVLKDRKLKATAPTKVLIVGAGKAGEMLTRGLLHDPSGRYDPIGFVDDDATKKGRNIQGLQVLGDCAEIPKIVADAGASVVVIAIASLSAQQIRRIEELCSGVGVSVRTIPPIGEILTGRATIGEIRPIAVEDVLNRADVRFDGLDLKPDLSARTVLVTGGGGSIGSEICRQIARLGPARLAILDVSEFNLYRIARETREAHPTLALSAVLADVCDAVAMRRVFERQTPDVVFHTAAYKHVPMLQSHLREAVRVNVLGTQTVASLAVEHAAECFVLVSSDKAVKPASALGASKRLAETVCYTAGVAPSAPRFITVRFGNVLDSTGSVLPLFREQIARGGPVTVTDKRMERYFMTIAEASQLIITAVALGKGGEVFVLDMGTPVRILDLAEQMIRLAGKVPGEDIAIEFIGAKPGENLSEGLFLPAESPRPTRHEKILLASGRPAEQDGIERQLARLREACDAYDESVLGQLVAALVPEYCPHDSEDDIPSTARGEMFVDAVPFGRQQKSNSPCTSDRST